MALTQFQMFMMTCHHIHIAIPISSYWVLLRLQVLVSTINFPGRTSEKLIGWELLRYLPGLSLLWIAVWFRPNGNITLAHFLISSLCINDVYWQDSRDLVNFGQNKQESYGTTVLAGRFWDPSMETPCWRSYGLGKRPNLQVLIASPPPSGLSWNFLAFSWLEHHASFPFPVGNFIQIGNFSIGVHVANLSLIWWISLGNTYFS